MCQSPSPLWGGSGRGLWSTFDGVRMHSASRSDTQRARQLRNEMTVAEVRLWTRLQRDQIDGHRFRRQVPIGPYVLDFLCVKSRLAIEVDGGQHAVAAEKDDRRTAWLEERGFRVLRFWNNDVLKETDGVVQRIREALTDPLPDPPHNGEGEI